MDKSRAHRDEDQRPQARRASRPSRHRPRAETRALLLGAATQVAIGRVRSETPGDHNLLAHIRIKDVLDEVNRRASSGNETRMTTGAFYQIWPDQASFQHDLLAHVLGQITMPDADKAERRAFEMVADGASAREILRYLGEATFLAMRQTPEIFLQLGLGALAPAQMVRDAQLDPNEQYLESVGHILTTLLRHAGLRVLPDRSTEDLIWAIEALGVGYLLRSRTHPDIPERADSQGWSALATAFLGLIDAFTETIPPEDLVARASQQRGPQPGSPR